jgi:hypothetical protein
LGKQGSREEWRMKEQVIQTVLQKENGNRGKRGYERPTDSLSLEVKHEEIQKA